MKTYAVTIRATVTKTIEVEAKNKNEAIEQAHELFTTTCEEGEDEDYNEEMLDVELIGDNPQGGQR